MVLGNITLTLGILRYRLNCDIFRSLDPINTALHLKLVKKNLKDYLEKNVKKNASHRRYWDIERSILQGT